MYPLGTGCKLNVLGTFNLRPVSRGYVLMQMKIQERLNNSNYSCKKLEKTFRKQNAKTVSK